MLQQLTGLRIDYEKAAVSQAEPPARRRVNFAAVRSNAGAIAAAVVEFFPENFFRLHIECTEPAVGGREIDGVAFCIAAKAAQAFFEWNIDLADELVALIDVKHENSFRRSRDRLGSVGRAHVEITLQFALRPKRETQGKETEKMEYRSHEPRFWPEELRTSITQLSPGAIGVEGQFVDQYALQQLFARATRKAIMGWALVTFHQAPASLSRCWITWRWPLSTSPEPMGKPTLRALW